MAVKDLVGNIGGAFEFCSLIGLSSLKKTSFDYFEAISLFFWEQRDLFGVIMQRLQGFQQSPQQAGVFTTTNCGDRSVHDRAPVTHWQKTTEANLQRRVPAEFFWMGYINPLLVFRATKMCWVIIFATSYHRLNMGTGRAGLDMQLKDIVKCETFWACFALNICGFVLVWNPGTYIGNRSKHTEERLQENMESSGLA